MPESVSATKHAASGAFIIDIDGLDGILVTRLNAGDELMVEVESCFYYFTILDSAICEAMVKGGPIREETLIRILGSSKGGHLRPNEVLIDRDIGLELKSDGRNVLTGSVKKIWLNGLEVALSGSGSFRES
jgi:hypothetical protein